MILSLCLLSVIINKTTWFLRLRLYFDLYTRFIVFVLGGTYKILRATSLLFSSNFFQSFIPGEKSIPFQLYLSIKALNFDILSGWFSVSWWFNATVIEYWKHLLSLFLGFIVALLFNIHSGSLCLCSSFLSRAFANLTRSS